MPNRWAVANGNWSSTATWSGSLIPTASDDVFANNFTVNVDISFQVLSLSNAASASAVAAGGSFNFNSGSISGSCTDTTPLIVGAANLITITLTTGLASLSAPNASVGATVNAISHTGNGNFTLTVSQLGILGALANISTISKTSTGTLIINGNLIITGGGGGAGNANCATLSSTAGNEIINGNILGNVTSGTGANNVIVRKTGGNLTINGNVEGGEGTSTHNSIVFSGTTLTINGDVSAKTGATANVTIPVTSAPTIIVTGSIVGGGVSPITLAGASVFIHCGSAIASTTSPAVVSTNASATNIFTGPFINTNDTMAVQCVNMLLTQDASTSWNFGDITLFSPEQLAYYPSASDIRQGITYADGTVSGSLAMPPPTAVIAGTPTDNTTGSAVLTATQLQNAFWGAPLSQMTDTGSIGARLAKSATTDSTGKQIASYLI